MGESINKYRPYVRLVSDGESKNYEITDSNLLFVGKDIQLKKIVLYTKEDLITDINVTLDRQYNEQFLATLIAAYGSADPISLGLEAYAWNTTNKGVKLLYYDKYHNNQSMAVFFME